MGQNPDPLVKTTIAGKWMFHPAKQYVNMLSMVVADLQIRKFDGP
jgi:hypothetical protein